MPGIGGGAGIPAEYWTWLHYGKKKNRVGWGIG